MTDSLLSLFISILFAICLIISIFIATDWMGYFLILSFAFLILMINLNKIETKLLALKKQSNHNYFLLVFISFLLCSGLFIIKFGFTIFCLIIGLFWFFIIGRIESLYRKEKRIIELQKENEFFHFYPDIEDKYKSAMKVIDEKGKNFNSYRELTIALLGKTKELYFSRKKIKEDNERIVETIKELEKVINDSKEKNDKITMLEKRLEKARKKNTLYMKFLNDTQQAIESTIYDFVGIKADIELSNSDTTKQIKLDNKALEEKSKNLSFLQEHLPVLDEEDDNIE